MIYSRREQFLDGVLLGVCAVLVAWAITACGREDKARENCVIYGDQCHDESNTRSKQIEGSQGSPGVPGRAGENGAVGNTGAAGAQGLPGTSCSVTPSVGGAIITCSGVSTEILNGDVGNPGEDGEAGADGYSVVLDSLNQAPGCSNGGRTLLVGRDLNRNNILDIGLDDQIQTLEVCNGLDAVPSQYSLTEAVDPCGDQSGADEILLRTAGNKLIAHYAGGGNLQFLTYLTPGSYVTTDMQPCYFTLDTNMNIINEHN